MQKIRQQIMLTHKNYMMLEELIKQKRLKNMSNAVNIYLDTAVYFKNVIDKQYKEIDDLKNTINELTKTISEYRTKIVNAE